MPSLNDAVGRLSDFCAARDLCWSIGRSRLNPHECRVYPMADPRFVKRLFPVVVETGDTFYEAIERAIERVERGELSR